jgi:hypothetical protein
MASTINTIGDINATYPVAGVDNDSQGFRDNFSAIKSGLTAAKNDIETLQEDGTALSVRVEDLEVVVNGIEQSEYYDIDASSDPVTADDETAYLGDGTYSRTVTLDFTDGVYQVFNASSRRCGRDFTIENFGPSSELTVAKLTIEIVQGADDQKFSISTTGVNLFVEDGIALPAAGSGGDRHLFELTSRDGGDTVYLTGYKLLTAFN